MMRHGACPNCSKIVQLADPTAGRLALAALGALGGGAATKSVGGVIAFGLLAFGLHELLRAIDDRCPDCGVALQILTQFM